MTTLSIADTSYVARSSVADTPCVESSEDSWYVVCTKLFDIAHTVRMSSRSEEGSENQKRATRSPFVLDGTTCQVGIRSMMLFLGCSGVLLPLTHWRLMTDQKARSSN